MPHLMGLEHRAGDGCQSESSTARRPADPPRLTESMIAGTRARARLQPRGIRRVHGRSSERSLGRAPHVRWQRDRHHDMRQHGKAVPYQRAVSAYPGRISGSGHGLAMTSYRDTPAIEATGLRKSFGDKVVLDGIDLNVAEGTIFSLLGPNWAGKTTTVHILSTLIGADGGKVRIAGHDPRTEPDQVRAAIGVTGQFSAVDNLLTGQENLILMADLNHLRRAKGRWRRRAARAVRPDRGGEEAGIHRLGRHEAAARPCHDAGRQLADRLPGRADRRPGPAQPPRHVADHPRAGCRRCHDLPHHPIPGGGGPACRPNRLAGQRKAGRRGHARRAQAAGSGRTRPTAVRRRRGARHGRPHPRHGVPRRRGADAAGAQRRRGEVVAGAATSFRGSC
jgi:hypothetical protein